MGPKSGTSESLHRQDAKCRIGASILKSASAMQPCLNLALNSQLARRFQPKPKPRHPGIRTGEGLQDEIAFACKMGPKSWTHHGWNLRHRSYCQVQVRQPRFWTVFKSSKWPLKCPPEVICFQIRNPQEYLRKPASMPRETCRKPAGNPIGNPQETGRHSAGNL